MLMLYQYVILYVFIIAILERSLRKKDGLFAHASSGASGPERTAGGKTERKSLAGGRVFGRLPGLLSLFVTLHVTLDFRMWKLFLLGVPGQIAIFLWFRMFRPGKEQEGEKSYG